MSTTSTTLEQFIQPAPGLVTEHTNPTNGSTTYAFPLQTKAWLKMQTVVQSALSFPLSKDQFTELYGTFTEEATVETALDILKTIHTTANDYGDPQTLISQIAAFQKADTAPDAIYANAVWLAAQTLTSAQQIEALLSEGLTDIGKVSDPQQRLDDLKELLAGDGGITSFATSLKGNIDSFEKKTATYYKVLNAELNGPTNSLEWYLGQANNILADAKTAVKNDEASIHKLHETIKTLNDEYIGFTVAASVSPVFLLIPVVGPFLAVADAATFAALAIEVKKQLDKVEKSLDQVEEKEKKKAALVTQLGSFNLKAGDVETDGTDFLSAIGTLTGGWAAFETQVNGQLSSLTVADVEDWGTFLTKVKFQAALDGWKLIASTAETFFDTGFAKFSQQDSL